MNREPVNPNHGFERPHHRLDAWAKAMELGRRTYKLTEHFPSEERYGLAQQMRRAAVSVISNVAEGAARQTGKEFEQFLYIAQGSLSELESQFELARSLGFIGDWPQELIDDVARLLRGLIRHVHRARVALTSSSRPNPEGVKSQGPGRDVLRAADPTCSRVHRLTGSRSFEPTGSRVHGLTGSRR